MCAQWTPSDNLVSFGGYLRSHYCTPLGLSVSECLVASVLQPSGVTTFFDANSKINSLNGLPPKECQSIIPSQRQRELAASDEEGGMEEADKEDSELGGSDRILQTVSISSFTVNVTLGKEDAVKFEALIASNYYDDSPSLAKLWASVAGVNVSQVKSKAGSKVKSVKGNFTLSSLPDTAFSGDKLTNETLSSIQTALSQAVENSGCSVCMPTITKVTVKSTGKVLYSSSRFLASNPGDISVEYSVKGYQSESIASFDSSSGAGVSTSFLNSLATAVQNEFPTAAVAEITSSSPSPSPSSSTFISNSSTGTNNNLAIGLGVGLGVGIPALILAFYLFKTWAPQALPKGKAPEITGREPAVANPSQVVFRAAAVV